MESLLSTLTQPPSPIFARGESNRSPVRIGTRRTALLYDIHVPYHDVRSLSAALEYVKKVKCDGIILAGDAMDFYGCSRYTQDPNRRSIAAESQQMRDFLKEFRDEFKKQEIVYMEGNHELRLKTYMRERADKLIGLPGTDLDSLLGLSKLGIRLVEDKRRVLLGDLNVLHGHEYPNIGSGVNPARSLYLKAKAYSIIGHCHRKSEHSEITLDGKSIACWSVGCLCNLSPDYLPYNNWSHGFAIVELTGNHFRVHNHYIAKDGKIY